MEREEGEGEDEEGEEGEEEEDEEEEEEDEEEEEEEQPQPVVSTKPGKRKVVVEGGRSDKGKKRRKVTKLKLEDGVRKIMMNSRWHSLEENVSPPPCCVFN